jgi:gliding motility-associated-like protein
LKLHIGAYGCFEPISGEIDRTHSFCFGSSIDIGKKKYTEPVTYADLLFSNTAKPQLWMQDSTARVPKWYELEVYTDRNCKEKKNSKTVDLYHSYDSTYYVVIDMGNNKKRFDSVRINVLPQPKLEIRYTPDIKATNRDFDMDEEITIKVDTSEYSFENYVFMMNNRNLNKYYLGGDSTKNEITLSAFAFSGVEDFLEIIAVDTNKCIVRTNDNVLVNIPYPTVFTPDGDGINDVFFGGEKFRNREFHLEVSNRWGNLLYRGESGWDGTYRGKTAPPGTYLYVIILKTPNGESRTVKGTVTLIRTDR